MIMSQTLAPADFVLLKAQSHVQSESADIDSYFALMLAQYHQGNEQCLFLPSLMSLAECFQCSAVEVHQSLSELKAFGCDFFIMGFESPITLWYANRLEGHPEIA